MKESKDFKIEKKLGANVIHKSGAPLMTIVKIDGDDISCKWYNNRSFKFEEEIFKEFELHLSELDWKKAYRERELEVSKRAKELVSSIINKSE